MPDSRVPKRLDLETYQGEAHIGIVSGTGQALLETAITEQDVKRVVMLELPGFLGLAAIILATDLIATLPRHTAETLAKAKGLRVLPCPVRIPSFTVKQYWHSSYHHDSGGRWLRATCAGLFQQRVTNRARKR